MSTLLAGLEWKSDRTLFPGSRSTEPQDSAQPWCCLSEVIPGLFLTCEQELSNREVALQHGIALIINLCAEEHVAPFKVYEYAMPEGVARYRKIDSLREFVDEIHAYTKEPLPPASENRKVFLRNIAAVDAPNYEIDRHFPETSALIELVMANRVKVSAVEAAPSRVPSVGVHCLVGVSRSASVVLAYLMKATGVPCGEALSFVQTTRWVVNPNPGFQQQLLLWEAADSKRVFDEFSAELVANEVRTNRSVVAYVRKLLPVSLKHNKCVGERKFFGYVVAAGLSAPGAAEDTPAVYRELRSYVTAAVDNEVYADTPNFFGYVAEVVHSIHRYAPTLLLNASTESQHAGVVWSDVFYFRVAKDIGRSGFVKDTCDTARAFCSLLEAIHVKQLAQAPLQLLGCLPENAANTPAPACFALSFPFLPFMAPYTEGFVQFSDLNLLEEQFPVEGAQPLRQGEIDVLTAKVADIFLSAFLVSTTGASSSAVHTSREEGEEEGEEGGGCSRSGNARRTMSSDADLNGRWRPTSRLLFLRPDVEVAVFETLSQSKDAAGVAASELIALCSGCSDRLSALAGARKVAAGILAYRLILETVDHFVHDAYRGRLDESTQVRQCEARFPLSRVVSLLESVGAAFTSQFNMPCGLQSYFMVELEPLAQSGVMHADGVWSFLKKT